MNSKQVLFSVIVPVYNSQKYISECLNSVLEQSFKDFELIVVDDGSSDCTPEIVSNISDEYANVYFIQQDNSGPNVARNKALQVANGKYVVFLDSDDKLHLDALEALSSLLQGLPDFISYGVDFFDNQSGKVIKKIAFPYVTLKGKDIIKNSLLGRYILGICWNKCVRRDLLVKNHIEFIPDKKHGRDILFSRMCSIASSKVVVSDRILCSSRYHDGSFSRSFSLNNTISAIDLVERQYKLFGADYELSNLVDYAAAKHLRYIIILSAFRVNCFKDFEIHLNKLKSSGFFPMLTSIRNTRSYLEVLLTILLKIPIMFWFVVSVIKKLGFKPY